MRDQEILELFLKRDEKAIAAVSEKYGSYCLKISVNILENREDAGECVNDTYLNAWNSIPPNHPENMAAFLGKITRNLSFNLYKKKKAEKRGGSQMALVLDELSELIGDPNTPESQLESKETAAEISRFLRSIGEEKRYMFIRRYWYTDTVKEIAAALHITENKVSVNLNRIRKDLKDYLTERGYTL